MQSNITGIVYVVALVVSRVKSGLTSKFHLQIMQKISQISREDSQENLPAIVQTSVNMKRRTVAGSTGIGFFVLAFGFIAIAFATPNWLVSDYRLAGAKLERLGLWVHCFRSLPDVNDDSQRRFFVGCRWVYDPFTTGYDEIRGFLLPGFMIATQFFFTLSFIAMLISAIGYVILAGGICASIAVILFASLGNRNDWMPEHANNWFGWSFILACIGAVSALVTATLFLTEVHVQLRKRRYFKESQTKFEMMHASQ
uniref:Uncharacterized protein n=1 Tax=Glossina palpalis gambiensis TaxID=67801 RepID=A0A1B0B997_9MUSC